MMRLCTEEIWSILTCTFRFRRTLQPSLFFFQQAVDFRYELHEPNGVLLDRGLLTKFLPMLFVFHGPALYHTRPRDGSRIEIRPEVRWSLWPIWERQVTRPLLLRGSAKTSPIVYLFFGCTMSALGTLNNAFLPRSKFSCASGPSPVIRVLS